MSGCKDCDCWIIAKETLYGDGSTVTTYRAPDGKGHCDSLEIDTLPTFGCQAFVALTGPDTHIQQTKRDGAPWQHWHMGPCPDCTGAGSTEGRGCNRCAGTGMVRHYDDGYVGEERTRLHPKQKELVPDIAEPKCPSCSASVNVAWKICPMCGHKLDGVAATEKVPDALFEQGD